MLMPENGSDMNTLRFPTTKGMRRLRPAMLATAVVTAPSMKP